MKSAMVFTIIFVLIIAGGFCIQSYLTHSAAELNNEAYSIISKVKTEAWAEATEEASALNAHWEKEKKCWLLLVEHDKIDLIDEAIQAALSMINTKEKPHSMEALGQFSYHIEDVPHKGRVCIANIF